MPSSPGLVSSSPRLRPLLAAAGLVALALGGVGCPPPNALIINLKDDGQMEKVDVYVRETASRKVVLHTGWTTVPARHEPGVVSLGITMTNTGDFQVFVFGLKGQRDCLPGFGPGDAAAPTMGERQFYYAFPINYT